MYFKVIFKNVLLVQVHFKCFGHFVKHFLKIGLVLYTLKNSSLHVCPVITMLKRNSTCWLLLTVLFFSVVIINEVQLFTFYFYSL